MRFPFAQTAAVYRYIRRQRKAGNGRFPLVLMLEPSGVVHMTGSAFLSTYRCDVLDHELPNDFWPLNDVLCGAVRIVQNGTLRSIGYADNTRFTNVGDCTYWSQRF